MAPNWSTPTSDAPGGSLVGNLAEVLDEAVGHRID